MFELFVVFVVAGVVGGAAFGLVAGYTHSALISKAVATVKAEVAKFEALKKAL